MTSEREKEIRQYVSNDDVGAKICGVPELLTALDEARDDLETVRLERDRAIAHSDAMSLKYCEIRDEYRAELFQCKQKWGGEVEELEEELEAVKRERDEYYGIINAESDGVLKAERDQARATVERLRDAASTWVASHVIGYSMDENGEITGTGMRAAKALEEALKEVK